MTNSTLKKTLIAIIIFIASWILCVIFSFVLVIVLSFLLRNHPALNLEMGWMAVIILVPAVIGTILSIPLSVFIISKINKKI